MTINNLIGAAEHEEDDYLVLVEEGLDTNELINKLCQCGKEVNSATWKNNYNLNFNVWALQLKWTPLFKLIYSRLMPTMHTSHATLGRAILLYAMIEKRWDHQRPFGS